MDFEGAGCTDGDTGDVCLSSELPDPDCGSGICPITGSLSGLVTTLGTFRANSIVTPVDPTDVDGTLTCRMQIKVGTSVAATADLLRMMLGVLPSGGTRVRMRHSGANLEILGITNSGSERTGWQDTGFGVGDVWALQVRYEPEDDVLELWWGSDFSGFDGAAAASASGSSPMAVDGISVWAKSGFEFAIDEWACDAQ